MKWKWNKLNLFQSSHIVRRAGNPPSVIVNSFTYWGSNQKPLRLLEHCKMISLISQSCSLLIPSVSRSYSLPRWLSCLSYRGKGLCWSWEPSSLRLSLLSLQPLRSHVTEQCDRKEEDTGPTTPRAVLSLLCLRCTGSQPLPRDSGSLDLGQGLEISVSNKLPCDSCAADSAFGKPWYRFQRG